MNDRSTTLRTLALLLPLLAACSPPPADTAAAGLADEAAGPLPWRQETLVPPGPFHGIHGITFDADGRLLVGSVVGASIYEVDPETGAVTLFRGPPDGMADDLAVAPDGTLAWTGFLTGTVWAQAPGDAPRRLASGLPGANSLAFTADGRLFFTQVFLGDALYEADLSGATAPRLIMEGMGGLNGFEFGPDGGLYGPLWFRGEIARVDVDAATLEVVATGFEIPAAVNFDSTGRLYAVDTARGEVLEVDLENDAHRVIATVAPAIDNLAIAPDDSIYITNMADNAVIHVDPESGATDVIVDSPLAVAADIALDESGRSLWVADVFTLRRVDLATGTVTEIARQYADALENPLAVGVGHGRVVTTSWSAGVIQRFDAATGASLGIHHGLPSPFDAVPLEGDAVLFVDFLGGRLIRASGADLEVRTLIAEGLEGPVAVLLDGEDAALVSEATSGRVVRIELDTGARTVLAEGLSAPEGIARSGDGALIVAEVGARRILRIDPEDGQRQVLAAELPIGFPAPPGVPAAYIPTGVAAAPDGSILFSSDLEAAIHRLVRP
ncbi:MAG: SMP-30/gluconolactonase/LRE family protein [Pseudomonadales bacterium]|jgi:sugar lactone lactonase YvrE|nr:SMP-30/gluconolactonase/LRE family protein [Pseudomonadales bacterium]